MNTAKQINDAFEPEVDFSCDTQYNETPVVTTRDLDHFQVYQTITVCGMVLFGENKAQPFPTKTDLIKREGSFVDEVGNIPITIWNKDIQSTKEGIYKIQNVRLRQFKCKKYLFSAIDIVFKKLTENVPHISEQEIKDAKDKLKTNEVTCEKIQTVDIMVFYNCLTCSQKVQFQHSLPMLRCINCQSQFLAKNARISVKTGDQAVWY